MSELETQFSTAGFHVVGVQEGRMPSRTVLSGSTYRMHVVEGVGTTHSLGLQMWVHKSLTAALGPVTVVSPRMCLNLKMRDKGETIRIKFMNATPLTSALRTTKFMISFTVNLVRQTLVGWVVILLGDMNANLGDSESPGVGPFSEDRENNKGTRLRAFAAEYNMASMNTHMDGCHYPLGAHHAVKSTALTTNTAISMKDVG